MIDHLDPGARGRKVGRRGHQLELRGRAELALARLGRRQDLLQQRLQRLGRDGLPVDGHPFAVAAQVRAGRLGRAVAGCGQRRCRHRGHAALAVGAADEHAAQSPLWMAQASQGRPHATEAQADADVTACADAG